MPVRCPETAGQNQKVRNPLYPPVQVGGQEGKSLAGGAFG